jgi:hypothetical protein
MVSEIHESENSQDYAQTSTKLYVHDSAYGENSPVSLMNRYV